MSINYGRNSEYLDLSLQINQNALNNPVVKEWMDQPEMVDINRILLFSFPLEKVRIIVTQMRRFISKNRNKTHERKLENWIFIRRPDMDYGNIVQREWTTGITTFALENLNHMCSTNMYYHTFEKMMIGIEEELRMNSISWFTRTLGFFMQFSSIFTVEVTATRVTKSTLFEQLNILTVIFSYAHLSRQFEEVKAQLFKKDSQLVTFFVNLASNLEKTLEFDAQSLMSYFDRRILGTKWASYSFVQYEMNRTNRNLSRREPDDYQEQFFLDLLDCLDDVHTQYQDGTMQDACA